MNDERDGVSEPDERAVELVAVLRQLEDAGHSVTAADVEAVLGGEQVQPQPRGDAAVVSAGLREFRKQRGI